jgi:hypothetical protein
MSPWEKPFAWMRQNVTASSLAFNAMSASVQISGLFNSFVRVKPRFLGHGMMEMMSHPIDTAAFIKERSQLMTNRARTQFRELAELRSRIQYKSQAMDTFDTYKFWLIVRAQTMVDYPTWLGAYYEALADNHGEEKAAAIADQVVIDTQGGGQTKDLSSIEADSNQALRLMTLFYQFMATRLNLTYSEGMTEKSKARFAVKMLMLYPMALIFEHALRAALTPDGDDWDELNYPEHVRQLLGELADSFVGLFVGAREFREPIKVALGVSKGFAYEGPTGTKLVPDLLDLTMQARQGEFDPAFRKAMIAVMGDVTGLPTAQINKTWTGIEALADDKTDNPAAVLFGYKK